MGLEKRLNWQPKTDWLVWIREAEKLAGRSLDGDQNLDGYSLDYAYMAWQRLEEPAEYIASLDLRCMWASRECVGSVLFRPDGPPATTRLGSQVELAYPRCEFHQSQRLEAIAAETAGKEV